MKNKIATLSEMHAILFNDNGEPLLDLARVGSNLLCSYRRPDHITEEQAYMRGMLHDVMLMEGFAPFYGEWWHFSYGDREWAVFYDSLEAIYAPILKYQSMN